MESVEALYSFRYSVTRMIYELYNRFVIGLKLLETRPICAVRIRVKDGRVDVREDGLSRAMHRYP